MGNYFRNTKFTIMSCYCWSNIPKTPLNNLIDIHLRSIVIYVKSYARDNLDILGKCPPPNIVNTVLATFHVIRLYTSIPHSYSAEAVSDWIEELTETFYEILGENSS